MKNRGNRRAFFTVGKNREEKGGERKKEKGG
jgi:hypothetical protein